MESRKNTIAFLLAALEPPAIYFALALAAHYLSAVTTAPLLLVAALPLPPLLWCCSRQRRHLCGSAPAYASVVGHFGTALLTFIVKLLPFVSGGLSITFFTSSCAFALVLTRMIKSDPGRVDDSCLDKQREGQTIKDYSSSNKSYDLQERRHSTSNAYDDFWRGKYCDYCHSFVERYDHHCAAVQNCIGRKNTGLFVLLLITLCITEMLFLGCCNSYFKDVIVPAARRDDEEMSLKHLVYVAWEVFSREAWVLSITVFVGLQVVWQVPFLIFQVYLIAMNMTTDEWVNWEEIPRFCKQTTTLPGLSYQSKTFVNPYDEGCVRNFKAMFHEWR